MPRPSRTSPVSGRAPALGTRPEIPLPCRPLAAFFSPSPRRPFIRILKRRRVPTVATIFTVVPRRAATPAASSARQTGVGLRLHVVHAGLVPDPRPPRLGVALPRPATVPSVGTALAASPDIGRVHTLAPRGTGCTRALALRPGVGVEVPLAPPLRRPASPPRTVAGVPRRVAMEGEEPTPAGRVVVLQVAVGPVRVGLALPPPHGLARVGQGLIPIP